MIICMIKSLICSHNFMYGALELLLLFLKPLLNILPDSLLLVDVCLVQNTPKQQIVSNTAPYASSTEFSDMRHISPSIIMAVVWKSTQD